MPEIAAWFSGGGFSNYVGGFVAFILGDAEDTMIDLVGQTLLPGCGSDEVPKRTGAWHVRWTLQCVSTLRQELGSVLTDTNYSSGRVSASTCS